jgi:L,D-transpeptidase YbiS
MSVGSEWARAEAVIRVSIARQRLMLTVRGECVMDVPVSTAKNGPGEHSGSECTPRGWHVVRAKIGAGCPENTVFVGRRPTGEIYAPALRARCPGRDWILTRILWLSGLEPGRNRLGVVDTMRRYVYIHGCPDEDGLGVPGSHGCVKVRNRDVIALFDRVKTGTRVLIAEE